jgi:rhodanese-related sulfurtransferase
MEDRAVLELAALIDELRLGYDPARLHLEGDEQVGGSPHKIATASAIALALQGAGVAKLWEMGTGRTQDVTVELPRTLQALHMAHTRQNGYPLSINGDRGDTARTPYMFRTADDKWCCLVISGATRRHQLERTLEVLGAGSPGQIPDAVAQWRGEELEEAIYANGAVAAVVRSASEWADHPQGAFLARRPLVDIARIADSEPEQVSPSRQPLSRLRVLECTHIIAGPTIGRTLAEQGADVLHVCPPGFVDRNPMIIHYGIGKRSAFLDLDEEADVARLGELAAGADVFIQSYRPGSLAARGFSALELARQRPGIVVVSVDCFNQNGGPWAQRRGVDRIAQAVSGVTHNEAVDGKPRTTRIGPLTDSIAGYLGAAGALAALCRRAREGGSYHVTISLARCGMWVQELGLGSPAEPGNLDLSFACSAPPLKRSMLTPFGELEYLAPVTRYSETESYFSRPPVPRGSSLAEWLPRC